MSDDLWIQVVLRNKIMEIAESITPIFKPRKLDSEGKMARFISVKNIEFEFHNHGEILEYETTIELLSDQGSWKELVIIREYNSPHLFQNELEAYKKLEQSCLFTENVQPLAILTIDEENSRIIYEGSKGEYIDDLNISLELADFQLGLLSATLQGSAIEELKVDELRTMIDYFLTLMPFNDHTREVINDLLESHYNILENSYSGYNPSSVFDPKFFKFTPKLPIYQITKSNISSGMAFEIDIIPLQPTENLSDRMVDLASCYGKPAYIEYHENKNVEETKLRILNFLEGYELAYDKVGSLPLEKIYPNGLTLDFHMLVSFWLLIYHKLHPRQNKIEPTDEDTIQYTYFLLLHQPFKMYDITTQEINL